MTTTRLGRLVGLAGVLALAAAAALPGIAVAAPLPGTAYMVGGMLYFQAGAGTANEVVVGDTGDGVLFLEDQHPLQLDPARAGDCVQRSRVSVRCPSATSIVVYLGDGRDYFNNYRTVTTVVFGEEGNDDLWGWFGIDRFFGGEGDDRLEGLPGADWLDGGEGNDTLDGDDGVDRLDGGDGNDILSGGRGDDDLFGRAGTDDLSGGLDVDYLDGGPGLGSVRGDDGDDRLFHSYAQSDLARNDYRGGSGADVIYYSGSLTGVRVSLNNVADDAPAVPVAAAHNVHDDIETVVGTSHVDWLEGSNGPDRLFGGDGDDVLSGLAGNDRLDASAGSNQQVYGDLGTDTCLGDSLIVIESCEITSS